MKKSTIIITLGLFIVVTALLGINNEKMYQKEKKFETISQVIQQLDNKTLKAIDEKGRFTETKDLKECFSERKRLTESHFDYGKIEIEKVEELDENQKQSILKDYNELRNNFSKRRAITKEEVVRLDAKLYYANINQGKIIYSDPNKRKIDLVIIDEGEGLVIDYIMENSYDKYSEEDNKDA
ncbi:hypothetical protein DIC82_15235 [Clostridium beijerinckii]|nr:hypothetical protein DIC82_15235 [Clostridium beijerinckii]